MYYRRSLWWRNCIFGYEKNYNDLYNNLVNEDVSKLDQNLKNLIASIKPCLKNIVDEINNVNTYNINKIKKLKKYLIKYSDFRICMNNFTATEEIILNKMSELVFKLK